MAASGTSSAVGDVPVCNKGYAITDCDLECGLTYETNNYNRIVGGSAAVESSWPSAALVIFSYSATINLDGTYYQISSSSMCGGTLIDKSTVLSAAHCIKSSIEYTHNGNSYTYNIQGNSNYPSLESTYTVYLGVQDRNTMSGATAKSVRKIIKHASYDTVNTLNDIALFKLTSDVTLSNRIQVACLPEESENFPESEGITASYAAGWGTLSSGGSSSAVLRDVDLNIYGSSSCANVAYGYTKDWDKQICAGDLAGTKDTCQGDSGGPLYVKKTVGGTVRYYVVGITSYGDGCATFGKPAIYTRTSYYYDWIRNNDSQNLYMKMIPLIVSLVVSIFFRF